jgi:hypothetical protein
MMPEIIKELNDRCEKYETEHGITDQREYREKKVKEILELFEVTDESKAI